MMLVLCVFLPIHQKRKALRNCGNLNMKIFDNFLNLHPLPSQLAKCLVHKLCISFDSST